MSTEFHENRLSLIVPVAPALTHGDVDRLGGFIIRHCTQTIPSVDIFEIHCTEINGDVLSLAKNLLVVHEIVILLNSTIKFVKGERD